MSETDTATPPPQSEAPANPLKFPGDKPPVLPSFPVLIGEIILLQSNFWDGIRPAIVVDLGVDEQGGATICVNVQLNGLRDADRLRDLRARHQGNSLVLTSFGGNAPMPHEPRADWFHGTQHPHTMPEVKGVLANVDTIAKLHGEIMTAVGSFQDQVAQTGKAIGERLEKVEASIGILEAQAVRVGDLTPSALKMTPVDGAKAVALASDAANGTVETGST